MAGSKTTKTDYKVKEVPAIDATEQALQNAATNYALTNAGSASKLNQMGTDSLSNVLNIDYNTLYGSLANNLDAINQKYTALLSGELPSSYAQNKNQYISEGLSELGGVLNTGAQKGVINSSMVAKSNEDIQKRTSEALGKQYSSDVALNQSLLNDAYTNAYKPISYASNAQSASMAVPASYYTMGTGLGSTLTDAWNQMANRRYSLASGSDSTSKTTDTGGIFSGLGQVAGALIGAASSACVDENTLVETENGFIPIKEVKIGDMVMGKRDYTEVELISRELKPCVDVVFVDNMITLTETQPIQVEDSIFRLVNDLSIGDMVMGKEIIGIHSAGERMVYELKVKDTYFYANGILIEGYTDEDMLRITSGVGYNG